MISQMLEVGAVSNSQYPKVFAGSKMGLSISGFYILGMEYAYFLDLINFLSLTHPTI